MEEAREGLSANDRARTQVAALRREIQTLREALVTSAQENERAVVPQAPDARTGANQVPDQVPDAQIETVVQDMTFDGQNKQMIMPSGGSNGGSKPRWRPPVRRAMPPPSGIALAKARAALSNHKLGKTAKHFVCVANLGPRGGPEEYATREAKRAKRLKMMNQGHQSPGPGSYDVTPPLPCEPRIAAAKTHEKRRRQLCARCYAQCWWGCECECHDMVDDDAPSESVSTRGAPSTTTETPPVAELTSEPRSSSRTRVVPPQWVRTLLKRNQDAGDFSVELRELDAALRRPPTSPDDGDEAATRLVAKVVRAAKNKDGTVAQWFARVCDINGEVISNDDLSATIAEMQRRLDGITEAALAELLVFATDHNEALSWGCLRAAVHRTLLAPRVVASRVRRSLDIRKERTADLFQRAQSKTAAGLASIIAPCLGSLVEEFAGPITQTIVEGPYPVRQPTRACCAATCYYGCRCTCHETNITQHQPRKRQGEEEEEEEEEEDERVKTLSLELGERVEVRGIHSDACFGGVVACVYEDAIDVHYDDGKYETGVALSRLDRSHALLREPSSQREPKDPPRRQLVPSTKIEPSRKIAMPQKPEPPIDAVVQPRLRGVVAWRPPSRKKKVEDVVGKDERESGLEQAERAVAKRRDVGAYAWSTVDRGLLPKAVETLDFEKEMPETPVSLQGGVRAHVPSYVYNEPSTPPLRSIKNSFEGNTGPGKYDPQWEATRRRAPEARIGEKKTKPTPQAALLQWRRRRDARKTAPGGYDVERAEAASSRHSRVVGGHIMPGRQHRARLRPDQMAQELEEAERLARKRRRTEQRAARERKRADRALRAKFRRWRSEKLGVAESKLSTSSEEDCKDDDESKTIESTDDEAATPASLARATRRHQAVATIRPEPQTPEAVAKKRFDVKMREARRGPSAYDVEKSYALVEPKVAGGARFGAEAKTRTNKLRTRAAVMIGIKRAAEQAARAARDKLVAPQLQHAWGASPKGDEPQELAAYRRSFVRTSKPVFRYVKEQETPDLVRRKRADEDSARTRREAAADPTFEAVRPKDPIINLSGGLGRDKLEILHKDIVRLSHFGSPTHRKALKAPRSPPSRDVESAFRALRPEETGAVSAFMAPERGEFADENDEGDVLELSPASPPRKPAGFTFPKAERLNPPQDSKEGDALDLDADREAIGRRTAPGHRFMHFSKQAEDFAALSAPSPDDEELWLSPRPIERSEPGGVSFSKAPRFENDDVRGDATPQPTLALSPRQAGKPRTDAGIFDFYSRQSARWEVDLHLSLDEAELDAAWLASELEAAPRIDEAERAARGALQLAAAESSRRAPDFSGCRSQRFETTREPREGDALDLDPNDDLRRAGTGAVAWSRQSDRWRPPENDHEGDVLKLELVVADEVPPRGHVDWSLAPPREQSSNQKKFDHPLLGPESDVALRRRLPNVVDIENQQSRDQGLPADVDAAREGDVLLLSPGSAYARRSTEQAPRAVHFPPKQQQKIRTGKQPEKNQQQRVPPTQKSPASPSRPQDTVLKGDGTNLVVALARLKVAVDDSNRPRQK